ncbi:MAG: MFS transporter [Clostridia bacterium]|nr:MFS transporter [Clostridia bacterium]
MEKGLKPTIGILATVPFIMVLGNSMLIPVLPAIRENLRLSLCQTGLLITAFSIPAGLVIPFAGTFSDYWGRKKIMVPALLVYGTGGLLAGLAAILCKEAAYPWLLGARIIQGIGAGGTYQLAMALAGDLIQGKERIQVLGLLEAANGLGKVVSPLAGAAVALLAWYAPFFVYGILAFPVALAVLLVAKEPPGRRRAPSIQAYRQSLQGIFKAKGVNLAVLFLAGMAVLFALFGLLSLVSDLLKKTYHYQVFHRGLVIAVPVLIMAVTAYLWGIILKRTPAKVLKWSLLGGLFLVAAGIFFFPVFPGPFLKITATALLGLGTGFVLPALNTLVTSSVPGSERGLITCLYGTVRFFGVAVGPPVFGLPVQPEGLFWSIAALLLAVLLLTAFLVKPEKVLPAAMTK